MIFFFLLMCFSYCYYERSVTYTLLYKGPLSRNSVEGSKENGEHVHDPCTAESEFALERDCLELQ